VDPIEAQIAAGLLQAEGIGVHLGDQNMALANWEWRLAIGGVKLHVRDDQAAHAREVIRRLDAGEFSLPQAADDDADTAEVAADGR
ncbi:putative signal transducing protein, partial [Bacillus sp. SIMBA_005]|uniref:putative signal transducing protein n=1 Tax=Bacillus sp. SIMBA_005 TaxID=3085754 RepID=UPI003978B4C1